jgi:hypothetical protein
MGEGIFEYKRDVACSRFANMELGGGRRLSLHPVHVIASTFKLSEIRKHIQKGVMAIIYEITRHERRGRGRVLRSRSHSAALNTTWPIARVVQWASYENASMHNSIDSFGNE